MIKLLEMFLKFLEEKLVGFLLGYHIGKAKLGKMYKKAFKLEIENEKLKIKEKVRKHNSNISDVDVAREIAESVKKDLSKSGNADRIQK